MPDIDLTFDLRPRAARFALFEFIHRQRDFSSRTFGPGQRTAGIVAHIRKELEEIEAAPTERAMAAMSLRALLARECAIDPAVREIGLTVDEEGINVEVRGADGFPLAGFTL